MEDDSDNDTVVSALADDGEVTFVTPAGHEHSNEDTNYKEAREESLNDEEGNKNQKKEIPVKVLPSILKPRFRTSIPV